MARARAMRTIWNWPPLIWLHGLSARCEIPMRSMASRAIATSSDLGWVNVPMCALLPMTAISSPVKP